MSNIPELHSQSGTMSWAGACSHHNRAHAQASLPCPNVDVHHICRETHQSRPAEGIIIALKTNQTTVTLQSLYVTCALANAVTGTVLLLFTFTISYYRASLLLNCYAAFTFDTILEGTKN